MSSEAQPSELDNNPNLFNFDEATLNPDDLIGNEEFNTLVDAFWQDADTKSGSNGLPSTIENTNSISITNEYYQTSETANDEQEDAVPVSATPKQSNSYLDLPDQTSIPSANQLQQGHIRNSYLYYASPELFSTPVVTSTTPVQTTQQLNLSSTDFQNLPNILDSGIAPFLSPGAPHNYQAPNTHNVDRAVLYGHLETDPKGNNNSFPYIYLQYWYPQDQILSVSKTYQQWLFHDPALQQTAPMPAQEISQQSRDHKESVRERLTDARNSLLQIQEAEYDHAQNSPQKDHSVSTKRKTEARTANSDINPAAKNPITRRTPVKASRVVKTQTVRKSKNGRVADYDCLLLTHPNVVENWAKAFSNRDITYLLQYYMQVAQTFGQERVNTLVESFDGQPTDSFDHRVRFANNNGIPVKGFELVDPAIVDQNEQQPLYKTGQRDFEFVYFRKSWEVLPIGITCEEILQQFPNHCDNENLDAFIQHGVTAGNILKATPPHLIQLLKQVGCINGKQEANLMQKRLIRRVAVGNAKYGEAAYSKFLKSPYKLYEAGNGLTVGGSRLGKAKNKPAQQDQPGSKTRRSLKRKHEEDNVDEIQAKRVQQTSPSVGTTLMSPAKTEIRQSDYRETPPSATPEHSAPASVTDTNKQYQSNGFSGVIASSEPVSRSLALGADSIDHSHAESDQSLLHYRKNRYSFATGQVIEPSAPPYGAKRCWDESFSEPSVNNFEESIPSTKRYKKAGNLMKSSPVNEDPVSSAECKSNVQGRVNNTSSLKSNSHHNEHIHSDMNETVTSTNPTKYISTNSNNQSSGNFLAQDPSIAAAVDKNSDGSPLELTTGSESTPCAYLEEWSPANATSNELIDDRRTAIDLDFDLISNNSFHADSMKFLQAHDL